MLNILKILIVLLFLSEGFVIADPLRVAVASNFKFSAENIALDFEEKYEVKVDIVSASTGQLYSQILNGAPYDVFMSADAKRPELLTQSKHAYKNSFMHYAQGNLALWIPNRKINKVSIRNQILVLKTYALADARLAPFGEAAKRKLIELEVWEDTLSKRRVATNILQAFRLVADGHVDGGFVSLSQLIERKIDPAQYILMKSPESYPINQAMVILKRSKQLQNAKRWVQFFKSAAVQLKLSGLGYSEGTRL